jgi:hypothetical protein
MSKIKVFIIVYVLIGIVYIIYSWNFMSECEVKYYEVRSDAKNKFDKVMSKNGLEYSFNDSDHYGEFLVNYNSDLVFSYSEEPFFENYQLSENIKEYEERICFHSPTYIESVTIYIDLQDEYVNEDTENLFNVLQHINEFTNEDIIFKDDLNNICLSSEDENNDALDKTIGNYKVKYSKYSVDNEKEKIYRISIDIRAVEEFNLTKDSIAEKLFDKYINWFETNVIEGII